MGIKKLNCSFLFFPCSTLISFCKLSIIFVALNLDFLEGDDRIAIRKVLSIAKGV